MYIVCSCFKALFSYRLHFILLTGHPLLNPNWHELREQEKCTSLDPGAPFIRINELDCQINPIHANFHLQKSLKIVDENSADKI